MSRYLCTPRRLTCIAAALAGIAAAWAAEKALRVAFAAGRVVRG